MSTRSTLLTAVTIVGAFAVGRLLASDAPAPAPVTAPQASAPNLSSAEIRSAVRAELQRERPTTIVTREAAPVEDEPTPEVLEQRANAVAQARVVVNSAINAGRWTGADARQLLVVLPQLGPDDHDEIMSALIRPVNAGRVKVETNGSLLDPT